MKDFFVNKIFDTMSIAMIKGIDMKIFSTTLLLIGYIGAMELEEHKLVKHQEIPIVRQVDKKHLNEEKTTTAQQVLAMHSIHDKWTVGCSSTFLSLALYGASHCATHPAAQFGFQMASLLLCVTGCTMILQTCNTDE